MKKVIVFISICSIFITLKCYSLESIEFSGGYLEGKLKEKGRYIGIPLLAAFNFDSKLLFREKLADYSKNINLIVEPFINTITEPDTNIEIGSNFLIKYTFPITEIFQPYLKAGVGALYMSQHIREQSTQYNFLPQAGGGFHFFINEKTAFNCEYRFRHLSNASLKHPNKGIDADVILAGITFFFK